MNAIDYNNLNLRSKTFLDFTDDSEIISEILGDDVSVNMSQKGIVISYMAFAELTPDKSLAEAINKEFAKDMELIFNE